MMTSRDDSQRKDSALEWKNFDRHLVVVLIKLRFVGLVVEDEFEVCGTYKKEVNEPVISWSEAIVDRVSLMIGPAKLLPTTPRRCTFDRRSEDVSGRTSRMTSQ